MTVDSFAIESGLSAVAVGAQLTLYRQQPLVSVIIPTRNRIAETVRAVHSTIKQTYPRLQIIVVDDCSDDPAALEQELWAIADSRIECHRVQDHRGANFARNLGVRMACGDYVAFLDSDDEWMPDKIRLQVAALAGKPDMRVCYCRVYASQSLGGCLHNEMIPARAINMGESVARYLFCARGAMVTPALLMPHELALRIPFDETLERHQDFAFLLALEQAGCEFLMLDDPLVQVNWQSLANSGRHLRADVSKVFLDKYHYMMPREARGGFWIRIVVIPYLMAGKRHVAIKLLLSNRDACGYLLSRPRELVKVILLAAGCSINWALRCKRFLKRILISVR